MVAEQRSALAELEHLAPQEIIGLTSPIGASAFGNPGTDNLILRVIVERWRRPGEAVRHEPLFIRSVGDERYVERMIAALPGDRVARFVLRFQEPPAGSPTVALLVELLDPVFEDPELQAQTAARAAASVRREHEVPPEALVDPRVGTLQWDASMGYWEGSMRWNRSQVRLRVEQDGEARDAALARLQRFLARRAAWQRGARELLHGAVLALKNSTWLDDGEAPLSAARFTRRVRLHTVVVGGGDSVELWYADDDLFGSHDIRLVGQRGPESLEFSLVG